MSLELLLVLLSVGVFAVICLIGLIVHVVTGLTYKY